MQEQSTPAKQPALDRRQFLAAAAGIAALTQAPACLAGRTPAQHGQPAFAYVGSGNEQDGQLTVFAIQHAIRRRQWTSLQSIASRAPAALAISPDQCTLYVTNAVAEHQGLPRGTVEAFTIDPVTGTLRLLQRQPLPLSAKGPAQLALPPDGKTLAIASSETGICSLMAIAPDGRLAAPHSIHKNTSAATRSSSTQTLAFSRSGKHLLVPAIGVFAITEQGFTLVPQSSRLFKSAAAPRTDATYHLDPDDHGIWQSELNLRTDESSNRTRVATVNNAKSIAIKTA